MIPSQLEYITQIDDWSEKYEAIMELGLLLPKLAPSQKLPQNLIKGCQSRVWIVLDWSMDYKLKIQAEADSRLVSGLIAIVIEIYKSKSIDEIMNINNNWVIELGLNDNLSMVRQNGLNSTILRIINFAIESQTQKNTQNLGE